MPLAQFADPWQKVPIKQETEVSKTVNFINNLCVGNLGYHKLLRNFKSNYMSKFFKFSGSLRWVNLICNFVKKVF